MIQPIVEGHGDVAAAPVLLRRLIAEAQAWETVIGRPIRRKRSQLIRQPEVDKAVRLARLQPNCRGILVMFDADTDCPAELGTAVRQWAVAAAADMPCEVVLPQREYEAWFLAAIESLRDHRGIRPDAVSHPEPEAPRGAKEQLEARMHPGGSYFETTDQPAFSKMFSMAAAHRRCRSFRKLTSSFGALLRGMGQEVTPWPPAVWMEEG